MRARSALSSLQIIQLSVLLSSAIFPVFADEGGKKLFKHGYSVNIDAIPLISRIIPTNVSWTEFSVVKKMTASAAYDIFVANWREQTVVIKSIRAADMRPSSRFEMEKEIKILSRLEHPNIIKLLGSGYLPYRFQILEYMGGGTLHNLLKRRISTTVDGKRTVVELLSQPVMFEYGIKLASALHYLHEAWHPGIRMIHRDLKPQNIGLSCSGELKLFDFGMMELIRKTADENFLFPLGVGAENGRPLGTWTYASPEVYRREMYNHKSDVYSYSMILYYVMVGRHPMKDFIGSAEIREYVAIYDGWRPESEQRWPEELGQLFAQMWNNDIYVRPNMEEIIDQLKFINETYPNWTRRRNRKIEKSVFFHF